VGVLSGPSFAADVVRGLPTATSRSPLHGTGDGAVYGAGSVGDAIRLYAFRWIPWSCRLAVRSRNVMAIFAVEGICRGRRHWAQAAKLRCITRAMPNWVRLGVAMGRRPRTLMGLSAVLGDLVLDLVSSNCRAISPYGIAVGKAAVMWTGLKTGRKGSIRSRIAQ